MSETRKQSAFGRHALIVAVGSVATWGTHCDPSEYPLAPSFCDDWCRVLLRSNCDQEPENCVRTCEQSTGPAECSRFQASLLACYEATPPSEFVCSGQGFQEIARPEERVCQNERDALIDCAYPEVKLCLDVCRAVEASQGGDARTDAQGPGGTDCPSYDIPCDSICWLGRRFLSDPPGDGGDGSAGGGPADASAPNDAGSGLGELADDLVACALRRAEACRSGDLGDAGGDAGDGGDTGSADAGSDGATLADENWSSVLLDCAEELGL
jgi:hypothetical protein